MPQPQAPARFTAPLCPSVTPALNGSKTAIRVGKTPRRRKPQSMPSIRISRPGPALSPKLPRPPQRRNRTNWPSCGTSLASPAMPKVSPLAHGCGIGPKAKAPTRTTTNSAARPPCRKTSSPRYKNSDSMKKKRVTTWSRAASWTGPARLTRKKPPRPLNGPARCASASVFPHRWSPCAASRTVPSSPIPSSARTRSPLKKPSQRQGAHRNNKRKLSNYGRNTAANMVNHCSPPSASNPLSVKTSSNGVRKTPCLAPTPWIKPSPTRRP